LAAMYFSCSWPTMKMASVVPLPGTKPNLHLVNVHHVVNEGV